MMTDQEKLAVAQQAFDHIIDRKATVNLAGFVIYRVPADEIRSDGSWTRTFNEIKLKAGDVAGIGSWGDAFGPVSSGKDLFDALVKAGV